MNYPQALPAPALRRITQKTPDTNYPYQRRYDAAALAGHLPLWPGLKNAVANTCKTCLWHTENNPLVCGQCPLVALLKNVLAEVTLRDKPAPRHLVAREHTNPFVGPLVDTRCGLTNQVPGEPAGCSPLCKRCVLYARAHQIPLPEEKPDENL